jgi:hypothetical protein
MLTRSNSRWINVPMYHEQFMYPWIHDKSLIELEYY